MRLQSIYEKHRRDFDFYWIYVREPHATESHAPAKHIRITQPATILRRKSVAAQCARSVELKIPLLVDGLDDEASKAFGASFGRVYLLDRDARVLFRSEIAPLGLKLKALEKLLAR